MATEGVIEEVSEESPAEPTRFTKILDIAFIIVLINLAIEIIVTVIAILVVGSDYLEQLMFVGMIGVVGFIIIIVVSLLIGAGYHEYGTRLRGWEEEQAADRLVNMTLIVGGFLTLVLAIGLYIIGSVLQPLGDPFALADISPLLGIAYSFWWIFGFIISALVLAVFILIVLVSS